MTPVLGFEIAADSQSVRWRFGARMLRAGWAIAESGAPGSAPRRRPIACGQLRGGQNPKSKEVRMTWRPLPSPIQ